MCVCVCVCVRRFLLAGYLTQFCPRVRKTWTRTEDLDRQLTRTHVRSVASVHTGPSRSSTPWWVYGIERNCPRSLRRVQIIPHYAGTRLTGYSPSLRRSDLTGNPFLGSPPSQFVESDTDCTHPGTTMSGMKRRSKYRKNITSEAESLSEPAEGQSVVMVTASRGNNMFDVRLFSRTHIAGGRRPACVCVVEVCGGHAACT